MNKGPRIAVLLHNVRSAHNVGSLFRTADASGVSRIYLTGLTPAPMDRFGRVQKEIAKTALGAQRTVAWERYALPRRVIMDLKKQGWEIVGVEQDLRAKDYRRFKVRKPTLLIFGNEVLGLSKELRAVCDTLIEIPMRGAVVRQVHHPRYTRCGKESLNVSVAAGIILFAYISNSRHPPFGLLRPRVG